MATYNRGHLIEESLRSIQDQSFQDWECLVIDDGSTDDTEQKVNSITANDPRFSYLNRPENYKKGLPGCRNYGLDIARGEYIIFIDDDDIVHPDNLSYCINNIRGNKYDFIRYNKQPFFGSYLSLTIEPVENSQITTFSKNELEKMITGKVPFASCCVLWNKRCFNSNRFNESLMYAEEWELYSRILMDGHVGLTTDAVLYFNRKHPDSNTGEFYKKDPVRVTSQIRASKLVIDNLIKKNLYNKNLNKFFIQLGFVVKSYSLITHSLRAANAGITERWKYKIVFSVYPLIRTLFILKSKISKL